MISELKEGQEFSCHCELKYCNCNMFCQITGLNETEVTYKYLSTNINGNRYKCEDTTTRRRFLEVWKLTTEQGERDE